MKRLLLIPFLLLGLAVFSQSNPDTLNNKHTCPVCKSHKDVIPIVYGKPATVTIQRAERGECWLGGCVVGTNSPRYYCRKDKKEF